MKGLFIAGKSNYIKWALALRVFAKKEISELCLGKNCVKDLDTPNEPHPLMMLCL
jgi:hypothetical protein